MADKAKEDYDRGAILAAGERALEPSIKQGGEIGKRFATEMQKHFGTTPPIPGKSAGVKSSDG